MSSFAGFDRQAREGGIGPVSFADYYNANEREGRGRYATAPPIRTRLRQRKPQTTLEQLLAMLPKSSAFPVLGDDAMRAKAKADAMAIIGPMLERANADYGVRVDRGTDAVKDYTGFFSDRLAGMVPQVRDAYKRQQDVTAGIGDALVGAQGAEGERSVGSLSDALKLMGAPNQAGTVGTQQALTTNAVGTTQRLSAAELMRLTNEGTAQESYAAQQPGIAALQGGETLRDFLQAAGDERASSVADINEQGLSLGQALLSQYYGANEANRGRAADTATARAKLMADWMSGEAQRKNDLAIYQGTAKQQQAELDLKYAQLKAESDSEEMDRQIDKWYKQRTLEIESFNAETSRINATKPPQAEKPEKPMTWADYVQKASGFAAEQSTGGGLLPEERSSWPVAYRNVRAAMRRAYPNLTDQQINSLVVAGLRAAGFTQGGSTTSTGPTGSPPPVP